MRLKMISEDLILEVKLTSQSDFDNPKLDWSFVDDKDDYIDMYTFIRSIASYLKRVDQDELKQWTATRGFGTRVDRAKVAAIINNTVFTKLIDVYIVPAPEEEPQRYGSCSTDGYGNSTILLHPEAFAKNIEVATLIHELTHAFDPKFNLKIMHILKYKKLRQQTPYNRPWYKKLKNTIYTPEDPEHFWEREDYNYDLFKRAEEEAMIDHDKNAEYYKKQVKRGWVPYFRTPQERLANINSYAAASAMSTPQPEKGKIGLDQNVKKTGIGPYMSRKDKYKILKKLLQYRKQANEPF